MDAGARKLSALPDEDLMASIDNTREAILTLGGGATKLGTINAGAANGRNHFVDQMSDTMQHRAAVAKRMAPRKLLSA